MKILAFGGSSSTKSINKQLATYTTTLFETGEIEILDLNDFEMPLFSVDKEALSGFPSEAHNFLQKISQTDVLIISLAEHNGSYSVAFKNILDWASRIDGKVFQNKPMLLMATSDGRRGGKSVLEAAMSRFPFMGGNIISTFSLPEFNKNFSKNQGILDTELKNELLQAIDNIVKYKKEHS